MDLYNSIGEKIRIIDSNGSMKVFTLTEIEISYMGGTYKIQAIPVEKKPPLGIPPKEIWVMERLENIKRAISKYIENGKIIPEKWIDEYNELSEMID